MAWYVTLWMAGLSLSVAGAWLEQLALAADKP